MFEFVCDHIVPGCNHKHRDEKREEVLDQAVVHLKEHHNLDHRDDPVAKALESTGISQVRSV